jgi:hypothetical protein
MNEPSSTRLSIDAAFAAAEAAVGDDDFVSRLAQRRALRRRVRRASLLAATCAGAAVALPRLPDAIGFISSRYSADALGVPSWVGWLLLVGAIAVAADAWFAAAGGPSAEARQSR